MNEKARIALGKAMGGHYAMISPVAGHASCNFPGGKNHVTWDPFIDANDCDALIQLLNERGYQVVVNHLNLKHNGVTVSNQHTGGQFFQSSYLNDWKLSVCDLACQALNIELKE